MNTETQFNLIENKEQSLNRNNKNWLPGEIEYLRSNWPSQSAGVIAKALNRTDRNC